MAERKDVLKTWVTGKDVENFEDGVKYQATISEDKNFAKNYSKLTATASH